MTSRKTPATRNPGDSPDFLSLSAYDYHLPPERIAQHPLDRRDASRLLVLNRSDQSIHHGHFRDLPGLLEPSDLLVLNNTRVIPARFRGIRETGGKAELLLLREESEQVWECLAKPAKSLQAGKRILFGNEGCAAEILEVRKEGRRLVRFHGPEMARWFSEIGESPLPPYIRRPSPNGRDRTWYQTLYASEEGAIAAPTAGLHFTEEVFQQLDTAGIERVEITLHIGPGTFRPIRSKSVKNHKFDAEFFHISEDIFRKLKEANGQGRRVVAVGTSTTRALESIARMESPSGAVSGWTELFIYPPFEFRWVRGLVTNFHLPRSSLLMLVSALAGRELILRAYEEAVREGYRFYSYGDAMLIL